MPAIWLCTREMVRTALEAGEATRFNAQLDRACARASEAVTVMAGWSRGEYPFHPVTGTRYLDFPRRGTGTSWRLYHERMPVLSLTSLTASGVALTAGTGYLLRPDTGPPYTVTELYRGGSASFGGADSPQRAVAYTGVFGLSDYDTSVGTLTGNVLIGASTIDVSANAHVGVGDVLLIGSERVSVDGTAWTDTTVNTASDLTASAASVALTVADGTAFVAGETLLIGAERVLVVDIAGNTLSLKRAVDGTALAAHTTGADIYAPRRLTVSRGVLGTTAAAHTLGDTVWRHEVPPIARDCAIAEAVNQIAQERSGYARSVGTAEAARSWSDRALVDLRRQVIAAYGPGIRAAAV